MLVSIFSEQEQVDDEKVGPLVITQSNIKNTQIKFVFDFFMVKC